MFHKYFVLTPTRIDQDSNPGSHFLTYGLKHLVSMSDPNAQFFDVNMLSHDTNGWKLIHEKADVLLLAGNPRLNFTEARVYWDYDIWGHIEKAIADGILFADLWAGAAYPFPLKSIDEMSRGIRRLKKTDFIISHEQIADLCVVRDPLAHEILKDRADPHLCFCSSWWAKDYLGVSPGEKTHHCITIRSMPGFEWLIAKVAVLQELLNQDKTTYIIVHSYADYKWFRRHAPDNVLCECLYDPLTLMKFYASTDKLLSFRLHASVPALSLGARVLNVSTDSRSLTCDLLGMQSIPYTRLGGELDNLEFQNCESSPDAAVFTDLFTNKIVNHISER